MRSETMQKIIERAKELRKESGKGGVRQRFDPYGMVPILEFYEAFIEYLETKVK